MKQGLTIVALLFLLLNANWGWAYDQEEKSLVIAQNISNQHITSFAEDAQGHIWIGTIRGLNKFNTFEYQQYFHTSDSFSISDNLIQQVYKDSKNTLWVATVNGICRYTDQDYFEQVPINSASNNAVRIFENNNGKLFMNLKFAIHAYNPETNSFELVIDDFDKNSLFTFCFVDKANYLWVVKTNEIRCYNSDTYELIEVYPTSKTVTHTYLNEDGKLWLHSWSEVDVFDTRERKFVATPQEVKADKRLARAVVINMYPYNRTSLLFQTQNDGIFLYNYVNGTILHQSDAGFPFEVPDVEITTMFTDSQKNLWLGSYDHGYKPIYYYKKKFNNNHFLNSKLEEKSVTGLTTDQDNNIWIVTRNKGMFIYNFSSKKFISISNKTLFQFVQSTFHHRAKKVFVDQDGVVWIMSDWMLLKARLQGEKVEVLKSFYFPTGIMSIEQDDTGTIWLGGMDKSIFRMAKGASEFEPFHLYGIGFNFTSSILSLSSGDVLIASFDQELQLVNPVSLKVSTVPIKDKILNSKFIPNCLFEDSQGEIWIGTGTNGLFRYSSASGEVKHFPGTASNDINSIIEDESGNIWIGTLYGLSKFDRTTQSFFSYYKADGIGGNQFNPQSVCRMPDNSLIFGGTHGVTNFSPIEVNYRRSVPLYLENLKIHNELQYPLLHNSITSHLSKGEDIHLDFNENSFTITYSAIDYSEFERVKYAYKLEGLDQFWIDANKEHMAYYSNVHPGTYTFKVRVYNDENTLTEVEKSVLIHINTPIWLRWYALLAYLFIIVLVIAYFLNIRKRIKFNKEMVLRAEREKEQEHLVNKMNMSFFSNLSHEFRTPLTMISGPVALLAKDSGLKGESKNLLYIIQRNIERMLRLVNQLMDFNKLENDTLRLKVRLEDIIEGVEEVVETFSLNAKEKGVELVTIGLEGNYIMWLDADKLDKILTNLIANALKFSGSDGKIELTFDVITREEAEEDFRMEEADLGTQFVKISISDTGKGIPEDKLEKIFERYYQLDNQTREFINWGTGIGLYYARCLVELHHGKIKAANNSDGGAVFTFILPTTDTVYSEEERAKDSEFKKGDRAIRKIEKTISLTEELPEKTKILVVDDDTEVVHYLRTVLSPHFNVSYKFDAESAFSALKEIEPELILSDVVMPGSNGYAFSAKVKENPSYCHIPVILVTAKATVENQVEGLNSGADAYVTKPFDPSYLIALINSQLTNREKIQSLLGSTTKTEKIGQDVLAPQDKKFMSSLYEIMEKELSDSELNINRITEVLGMSRTKFYYKVKGLTGENPNVFFRTYKLNRAAELILEGEMNISEIANYTGFSTPSHFSVSFKKQFGVSPSAYKDIK